MNLCWGRQNIYKTSPYVPLAMLTECKAVNPKGNQPWKFTGRIDAEAEAPILWLPDAKSWLIWKDPDAGKDRGQEVKGATEDEVVGWHHQLNGHEWVWANSGRQWRTEKTGVLQSMGSQRVRHDTERVSNSHWVQRVLSISSDDIMENQAFTQAWVWLSALLSVTCVVVLIIVDKWLPP